MEKIVSTLDAMPSIFDGTGTFVPIPEAILDEMTPEHVARYQRVADSFSAALSIEKSIDAQTRDLHQTVKDLRDAQREAATSKLSFHDNWKAWKAGS